MDITTLAAAKAYTDKQRLAHSEIEKTAVYEDIVIPIENAGSYTATNAGVALIEGATYIVNFDGVEYERVAIKDGTLLCIGNPALYSNSPGTDNGDFFLIYPRKPNNHYVYALDTSVNHTISLYENKEVVYPLDKKYIPAVDAIVFNGGDGKQYKLFFNAEGTIQMEEVV